MASLYKWSSIAILESKGNKLIYLNQNSYYRIFLNNMHEFHYNILYVLESLPTTVVC